MDHGNYVVTVTQTMQEITTLKKEYQDIFFLKPDFSSHVICKVIKQLRYFFMEAQYSEIREVLHEILFVSVILLFTGIFPKYHITVQVDNNGSIFLSENTLL